MYELAPLEKNIKNISIIVLMSIVFVFIETYLLLFTFPKISLYFIIIISILSLIFILIGGLKYGQKILNIKDFKKINHIKSQSPNIILVISILISVIIVQFFYSSIFIVVSIILFYMIGKKYMALENEITTIFTNELANFNDPQGNSIKHYILKYKYEFKRDMLTNVLENNGYDKEKIDYLSKLLYFSK